MTPPPTVNDYLREDYAARGEAVDTFRIGGAAARHVAAYLEYDRIVGGDDGGQLLSEEEYAAYLARAGAMRGGARLYITWRCRDTGVDCKSVGPSTRCFCGHLLKQHTTDNVSGKQEHAKDVHCKVWVTGSGCAPLGPPRASYDDRFPPAHVYVMLTRRPPAALAPCTSTCQDMALGT